MQELSSLAAVRPFSCRYISNRYRYRQSERFKNDRNAMFDELCHRGIDCRAFRREWQKQLIIGLVLLISVAVFTA
jgi:hypothetical protein